jgi:hypothetical protein
LILLLPPVLDQHLTLKQSSEDFHVEKLLLSFPLNDSMYPFSPDLEEPLVLTAFP